MFTPCRLLLLCSLLLVPTLSFLPSSSPLTFLSRPSSLHPSTSPLVETKSCLQSPLTRETDTKINMGIFEDVGKMFKAFTQKASASHILIKVRDERSDSILPIRNIQLVASLLAHIAYQHDSRPSPRRSRTPPATITDSFFPVSSFILGRRRGPC